MPYPPRSTNRRPGGICQAKPTRGFHVFWPSPRIPRLLSSRVTPLGAVPGKLLETTKPCRVPATGGLVSARLTSKDALLRKSSPKSPSCSNRSPKLNVSRDFNLRSFYLYG